MRPSVHAARHRSLQQLRCYFLKNLESFEVLPEILREPVADGEARGKAEGLRDAARKMLALGITLEAITAATGVRPEEL